jgi:LysM repeat protein
VWRSVVALIGTTFLALGGVASAADTSAQLTIDADTGAPASVLVPTEATLTCNHGQAQATGFLKNVAKPACALVRRGAVTAVAKEHRGSRVCTEGYGGPQRATIDGTINGRQVSLSVDRTDGCGIADWQQLLAVLGDPGRSGTIPRRPATPPTTTTAPRTTYQVKRGDTLTQIAKQFHTSVSAIMTTNQLPDADHVAEGQVLVMPPPGTVRIVAKLVDPGSEDAVRLTLSGAAPAELVTFVITLPDGETFTGSPHSASSEGVVTSTYTAPLTSGTYTIDATGDHGTTSETSFHLDRPG